MAKDLTLAQIWAVISTAGFVVVLMAKHFKDLIEALPSLVKAWKYVQKKWFSQAIFRADVLKFMDNCQLQLNEIKAEVKPNGGNSMKDVVKRMQDDVAEMKGIIQYNKSLREVTDKCSERMLFKMNPDGACTFINEAFLKFFGYAEADVLQFGFEDLVHEDDVREMREKWNMAITRKTKFNDEQRIRDVNGVEHHCLVKGYPICKGEVLVEFYGTIDII